jgi:adenylosuccinate lyase
MSVLAVIAASLEKIALEIRHLQRTEVLEAEEYFSKGQKGSSAMPHKRNPVISERICGLARIIRSNALAALENVALWHERDISHSSVERIIIPDSCIGLDYMLDLTVKLVKNLIVYPDNMLKNLNLTKGLIFSQNVLLKLTDKGISREDAYKIVQSAAMNVWEGKGGKTFEEELLNSGKISEYLSPEEIKETFNYKKMLKNVDYIFARSIEID